MRSWQYAEKAIYIDHPWCVVVIPVVFAVEQVLVVYTGSSLKGHSWGDAPLERTQILGRKYWEPQDTFCHKKTPVYILY